MEHLDIWQKVARPPKEALKQIEGGRLKGKTDISPQWRLKVMTELFGPCGTTWGYTIDRLWTETGHGGEVMAFAQVTLWYLLVTEKDTYRANVPGIGGAALVANERNGLYSNDEAYKMAVTDALSVAMKALGVAADIYAGLWDGTKYKELGPSQPQGLERPKSLSAARPPDATHQALKPGDPFVATSPVPPLTLDGELSPEEKWGRLLNKTELGKLTELRRNEGVSAADLREFVLNVFQISDGNQIREHMVGKITSWLKQHGKAVA